MGRRWGRLSRDIGYDENSGAGNGNADGLEEKTRLEGDGWYDLHWYIKVNTLRPGGFFESS